MYSSSLGKIALLLLVAASAAVAVFLLLGSRSGGALLQPGKPRLVARGEAVYMEQCASCHGRDLQGQPDWQSPDEEGYLPAPPHDQTGHTWHHPDRLLFDITKVGVAKAANLKNHKTRMPAFEGILNDADIIAALSYVKSRWSEDLKRRHDALNRSYEQRGGASL
jgi:mono/diheme cytochrome c family protein